MLALLAASGASAKTATSTTAPPRRDKAKPVVCKGAEKAIVYYRNQVWSYQKEMGIAKSSTKYPENQKGACGFKRAQAHGWQTKARVERKILLKWRYDYAWWLWLPDKWQRIGACETGYGRKPGDFHWNSGTYQGFVGFYYGTWDQYKPAGAPSEAYLATPRQQWQTAENVKAVHGYGAWGCGGA